MSTPEDPCTDDAALLLPWYVNGSLDDDRHQQVASHLATCPTCRADVQGLGGMAALMRRPAQVEHGPQAGLRRLLQRIDGDEAPTEPANDEPPRRPAAAPVQRWLVAAVLVQAVGLATLGSVLLSDNGGPRGDAAYRTYSSAEPGAPHQPALRVVLAPETTLAELQALVQRHRLSVQAGPSEAGLVTLVWRDHPPGAEAERQVLQQLRQHPRVRFAEPAGPAAAS